MCIKQFRQLLSPISRRLNFSSNRALGFEDFRALLSGERSNDPDPERFLRSRLRTIWEDCEHRFVLLSSSIQQREREGRHWLRRILAYWHNRRINRLLGELAVAIEDQELLDSRADYIRSLEYEKRLDGNLADLKASSVMQGESDRKIQRAARKIETDMEHESAARAAILSRFIQRMAVYGVDLTEQQAEVLLSRIDAGDVARMSSVFVIIAGITRQFANAKQQSGENIEVAKKYYGIYIGLLELQMHIQDEYIDRVNNDYLPGVAKIGNEARQLAAETRTLMKSASEDHIRQYEKNIASQEFTVEVTEIYESSLRDDREKVVRARELVQSLHNLAENTLSTVRVSADLASLVRQAEGMYKEVMSLQTPELVPFDNLQLQKEFEAVTFRLRTGI